MPTDDWRIILPFARLSELQWLDLLTQAELTDDRPKILLAPYYWPYYRHLYLDDYRSKEIADAHDWIKEHFDKLLPVLFRVTDPPNSDVAILAQQDAFYLYEPQSLAYAYLQWPMSKRIERSNRGDGPLLTELCAASSLMCELYVAFAAAYKPLGIEVEPPNVEVAGGSVQFKVSGGMFAAGLGLIVACSAGMVSAPIVGPTAGIGLATMGAIDLAIGWKQKIAETKKTEFEQMESYERTKGLAIDNRKKELEYQLKQIELEKAQLELEDTQVSDSKIPSSAVVPRELVLSAADAHDISEAQANHTINRTLPTFTILRQKTETEITIKIPR